jgi:hypothetical protein
MRRTSVCVLERINRLKQLTVDVKAGRAVIYAQFVPESQRRALAKMSAMVESRTLKPVAANTGSISMPPQSRMVN